MLAKMIEISEGAMGQNHAVGYSSPHRVETYLRKSSNLTTRRGDPSYIRSCDSLTGLAKTPRVTPFETAFLSDNENSGLAGFERDIARVSGARHCIVFGSGPALTSSIIHLQGMGPGDNIVCVDDSLDDGAPRHIVEPKMGVSFDFVEFGNEATMRSKVIMDKTKLLWLKTSSNPNLVPSDLRSMRKISQESGSLLVIEESFFPMHAQDMPAQDLLEHGADLVVVSSMGARAVCTNNECICTKLRLIQERAESLPSPFGCFLSLKVPEVLQLATEEPQEKGPIYSWKKRISKILGLSLDTKVKNKSSKEINAVVSPESIDVTIQCKFQAGVKAPCVSVTASIGSEVKKKPAPPQQVVISPGETRRFELETRDYYLTIYTKKEDGSFAVHEKNVLVRASQNWTFDKSDLKKEVETLGVAAIEKDLFVDLLHVD